ncbi:Uncharacterised protein [Yersinia aldovae]|nr:Uncharacterised protein [Yersinia aldovae]
MLVIAAALPEIYNLLFFIDMPLHEIKHKIEIKAGSSLIVNHPPYRISIRARNRYLSFTNPSR